MKNDYQTSTVDGAAGFARFNAVESLREDEEYYNREDESDDYDEDYEPDCNCSDPGCPCGGSKRGGV